MSSTKLALVMLFGIGAILAASCVPPPPRDDPSGTDASNPGCPAGLVRGSAEDLAELQGKGPAPSTSLLRQRNGGSELVVYASDGGHACALQCPGGGFIVPDTSGGFSCGGPRTPKGVPGLGLHASSQTVDTPLFGVTLLIPFDLRSPLEQASSGILGRPGKALQAGTVFGVWADEGNEAARRDELKRYEGILQGNELAALFVSQKLISERATASLGTETHVSLSAPDKMTVLTTVTCPNSFCPLKFMVVQEGVLGIVDGRIGTPPNRPDPDPKIVGIAPETGVCALFNLHTLAADIPMCINDLGRKARQTVASAFSVLPTRIGQPATGCPAPCAECVQDVTLAYTRASARDNDVAIFAATPSFDSPRCKKKCNATCSPGKCGMSNGCGGSCKCASNETCSNGECVENGCPSSSRECPCVGCFPKAKQCPNIPDCRFR